MKKTQIVELFKNIQKSIVSFISISFFVMLATAIFLGIGWSEESFKETVNKTVNDLNLHDAQVSFPYGFDDEYISKLNSNKCVDGVEGIYYTENFFVRGSNKYQGKIISLSEKINIPSKLVGRLPQKAGEIAIERYWAEKNGFEIGETITFEHNDDGDAHALSNIYNSDIDALQNSKKTMSGMKNLITDKFVVTGFVETAQYMNQYKVTYGVSATTMIPNDCILYVTKDSFDRDSYIGYPEILITNNSIHSYSIYSDEYENAYKDFKSAIETSLKEYTDSKNSKVLEGSRNTKKKIEDKIVDGENKIVDNESKINDGEIQIADGRKKLVDGKKQLEDARKQIDDGYNALQAGKRQLEQATAELSKVQNVFDFAYNSLNDYKEFKDNSSDIKTKITTISTKYESIKDDILDVPNKYVLDAFSVFGTQIQSGIYDSDIPRMLVDYTKMIDNIQSNSSFVSFDKVIEDFEAYIANLSDGTTKTELTTIVNTLKDVLEITKDILTYPDDIFISYLFLKDKNLDDIFTNEVIVAIDIALKDRGFNNFIPFIQKVLVIVDTDYSNYQEMSDDIYDLITYASGDIDVLMEVLDEYKSELDSAWNEIRVGQSRINNAENQLYEAEVELAKGWDDYYRNIRLLNSKQKELEDGKVEIADAKLEIIKAKEDLNELDDKLSDIKSYDYSILGRSANGGIASTTIPSKIMRNAKYTMALLFVIVGIFVCYSALSRTVYEQTVQIGTKKALGLSDKEIVIFYLAYAIIAVSVGSLLGTLLARYLIEPVIVKVLAKNYNVGETVYYLSFKDSVSFFIFELSVSLLTTYLACKKVLKEKAIALLSGQSQVFGKQRFYEKTKLWQKLPLFTKTIINNCFNDSKRVFATLVGVAGCCSLIVCAVTLYTNMNESFAYQMENITKYDTLIYYDSNVEDAKDNLSNVLSTNNIDSVPAYYSSYTIKSPDDSYYAVVFLSYNSDKIFDYFGVEKDGEQIDVNNGICISKAYAEYYDLKIGDVISFIDSVGKEHVVPISGVFDYYLLRGQLIMNPETYRKEFGEALKENVLLLKRGDTSIEELYDLLNKQNGFVSVFDYRKDATELYSALTSSMSIVEAAFLVLSVFLAFLVLLNLYVMFISEKKRELIVLMINGYSRKDAKRYIYEDTIFITIIGIIIGTLIGVVVGFITLNTFTTDCVIIMKNINIPSYLLCAVITIALSFGTCLLALSKISKFKLTDINKA